MTGYYSREDLLQLGFESVGEDVQISEKACFYGAGNMRIGNHVRIDDFCIFIGDITLGDYIHIAGYVGLHASKGSITIKSFSTLSSRVAVYAASDDYSGAYMTNSVVPKELTHTIFSDIVIGKHVVVGTGSTILPGAILPDGVAIGAMSLVKTKLDPWAIYAGIPCKKIKERTKKLLRFVGGNSLLESREETYS